jgi:LDH2 family malate/lactate/ureidoglycolate dehydrogenase
MRISIADARRLSSDILTRYGMLRDHADALADHLVYAEASGEVAGGIARTLSLVDELLDRPAVTEIRIEERTASSATVDGGGHTGYVTSAIAMDKAIACARATGFGIVGMSNAWFSGQLSYYVLRAAEAGFVAIHGCNAKARVAPTGGVEAVLGTNPLAFGFPCDPRPILIDIGTSSITVAELMLRQKLGHALDDGTGIDCDGNPSNDPAAVWSGAMNAWGGHRGYGVALAVQLLGIMCGGVPVVRDVSDTGFFFIVVDPQLLMPLAEFKEKARTLVSHIEASKPAPGVEKVRVHGMASAARREKALARGHFELSDEVYGMLVAASEGRHAVPALSNRKGAGQ